ncbi:hypothetical protein BDB00DRAFT_876400 [Zychaea mexicana]|uniref:uncharacterized protein n=1 Tax=Zychaea mexicana TaxID=64656 RepID=UPI0022FDD41D|nr:uncharacterized protein BDB00DRAFT_876400 [Zychaea mexicana]KAI9489410.1 hypothetical protein BDB00DRAFT_876400 [Zychaea mexicana]
MLSRNAIAVPRRSVAMLSRRLYSSSGYGGSEGATASSKGGFSDKEKAVENQWARSHDAEKIKALHEALEKQKEVTKSIEKDLDDLKKSSGKK